MSYVRNSRFKRRVHCQPVTTHRLYGIVNRVWRARGDVADLPHCGHHRDWF